MAEAELQTQRTKRARARQQVMSVQRRNQQRIDDLEWELDSTAVARDKALYWLLRLCEASEREGWQMSDESREAIEHASNLLFEHNIYIGLPEPDMAILHLMEIVTVDLEQAEAETVDVNL